MGQFQLFGRFVPQSRLKVAVQRMFCLGLALLENSFVLFVETMYLYLHIYMCICLINDILYICVYIVHICISLVCIYIYI